MMVCGKSLTGGLRMNPYEVLGVSRNASIDEIKKAYKELSRKYHPDSYVGNPLSSLAEEKFKQVQEAYDAIMKEKNGDYNYAGNYNNNGYNNSESGEMAEVYNLLGRRAYSQALSLLDSMPNRNAKWYYYSAIAQVGLGNNLRGMEYARMAVSMEPNNIEYQNLVNRLSFQGNRYGEVRNVYRGGRSGFDDASDLCCKLWLADSLCECMGGDLCSCM
jgi:hypothetical protein